jgi:hypothetical protein
MVDAHPRYQRVLYVACWVILAALIVVALTDFALDWIGG